MTVRDVSRGRGRLEVREGKLASQQLPETESEGEDVSLDGVFSALSEDLGSHPSQVTRLLRHVLLPEVGQEPRLSEVRHHGAAFFVKKYVVTVEVPVDDGLRQGVEVVHTTGDIQGNVDLSASHEGSDLLT